MKRPSAVTLGDADHAAIGALRAVGYATNRSAVVRKAVRFEALRVTGLPLVEDRDERRSLLPIRRHAPRVEPLRRRAHGPHFPTVDVDAALRRHEFEHGGPVGTWKAGPIGECLADICADAVYHDPLLALVVPA